MLAASPSTSSSSSWGSPVVVLRSPPPPLPSAAAPAAAREFGFWEEASSRVWGSSGVACAEANKEAVFVYPYMKGYVSIWYRVCLGLSLLSISLWLSRMMSLYLSCNSCCNSLLARIAKQSNSLDVWFLVATSIATEKTLVATQFATQLHKSQYKSNGLEFC
jgi:hypothetical protein